VLIQHSLDLIPKVVGGQDLIWYFKFLTTTNVAARRLAFEFGMKNFDLVSLLNVEGWKLTNLNQLESELGSFMISRLILV